jgi:hypothetical protein
MTIHRNTEPVQYEYIFIGDYDRRFNFDFNSAPGTIAGLAIPQMLMEFVF